MDDGVSLVFLTAFIILCVYLNSLFVLIETALAESGKSRLERLADDGDERAQAALVFFEAPENLLSVAQIGITFTSMLLGAAAGSILSLRLADYLSFLPHPRMMAIFLVMVPVIYIHLLFGEFIPKKIAMQDPERVLRENIRLMKLLGMVSRPFVSFLSASANSALLLLGMNPYIEDTVTEDEVKDLIEQGTEDGTFEKAEQAMVDRIFHMSDQTAYSLMTPRTRMKWLDIEDPADKNLSLILDGQDTVFPVGRGSLDDFCGVLYAKDLLDSAIRGEPLDIAPHIKKPLLIPRSLEPFRVLEKFREGAVREAVVLDEYGGVIGFITLGDIVEEIIGDASGADEREFPGITPRSESSWHVDGLCAVDDFKEKFDIDTLPNEEKDHYQTIGGFITSYFGYIPSVGERCTWEGFTFEVLRMDRARVAKILVSSRPQGEA